MARIRTIKPEFWSHPIISRLDDCTKLLALALLNYADDEGYFLANCTLVRNFARPFDLNTRKVKVSLEKLIKIGFISVRENVESGEVGKIVKFAEHQKVDHPKASTLKEHYFANDSREIRAEFAPEGKGREGKGREGSRNGTIREEPLANDPHKNPEAQNEIFEKIKTDLTGDIYLDAVCSSQSFEKEDFKKFILEWLELKRLGDKLERHRDFKIWVINDYREKVKNRDGPGKAFQTGNPKNPTLSKIPTPI